jgi:hypothetical protein
MIHSQVSYSQASHTREDDGKQQGKEGRQGKPYQGKPSRDYRKAREQKRQQS